MRNELLAAVEYFKSLLQTIADDEWNREARNSATSALTALRDVLQRQPDPETGLVPCGCGGSASCYVSYDDEKWVTTVKIVCNKCLINVAISALYELRGEEALADDAKRAWNTAMSGGTYEQG